jgi:NitT/TauT family transport system substrate-binding protein
MFLAGAAAASLARRASAAPALETTRVRLVHDPSICVAPQYLADDLLRTEGFTDVQYVQATDGFGTKLVAAGEADLMMEFAGLYLSRIDAGDPIVLLAGVHVGCFEIFGGKDVRTIRDLKSKKVAVLGEGVPEHIFLASVMAYVGLDPKKDVQWQSHSPEDSMRLLAEGKIDAYAGFPPVPQELRSKRIGTLILNTSTDRPWSQYFCCMLGANRSFVEKNPAATKAVARAILKAADICQADPDRAARFMVSRGYTGDPEYARQAMREIPYAPWRTFDPADTVRFYGLRLHEAGMISQTPNRLASVGTDWRFLKELKAELKG